MTSAQVVETSVTNNSSFQNYSHPDDHTIRTTDTPGFKPFTIGPIVDDQGHIILEDKNKAEAMNDYFVAVGPNLASQINPIPNSRDIEHIYRITPTLSSVSLNKSDLLRRIKSIKPNKASGPDSIAPRDLHLIGEASAEGLYTVLRHSLLNSSVPSQWKVSRMLTTHKKGNKAVRGNYRVFSPSRNKN